MRAELNVMGLALEFLGGIFLATSILRFLFRAKSYVHDYQEAWNAFIASRPDLEEEAIRYHEGTLGVDIGGDLERGLREKEFVRAKLRLLDWIVYRRAEEEKEFYASGSLGSASWGPGSPCRLLRRSWGPGASPPSSETPPGPHSSLPEHQRSRFLNSGGRSMAVPQPPWIPPTWRTSRTIATTSTSSAPSSYPSSR
jgi:hypothetical protein